LSRCIPPTRCVSLNQHALSHRSATSRRAPGVAAGDNIRHDLQHQHTASPPKNLTLILARRRGRLVSERVCWVCFIQGVWWVCFIKGVWRVCFMEVMSVFDKGSITRMLHISWMLHIMLHIMLDAWYLSSEWARESHWFRLMRIKLSFTRGSEWARQTD